MSLTGSRPARLGVRIHARRRPRWPALAIAAIAVTVAAPAASVTASLFAGAGEAQAHIWSTMGPRYLFGTLALCVLVGFGAGLIGSVGAALTALTEFPGRRFFSVALALPFAAPAYVVAYAYADFLGPFGPFASVLRDGFGVSALPEIRSMPGAAFVLTLTVYPYVYLAMRADLAARSTAYLEAARALGAKPAAAFRRVLAPAARAAFAGGLALALMETAADFGVADYFGVATLSVGIVRTWQGLGDLTAAAQLAAGLFFIAALLAVMEESARRGERAESARARRGAARLRLSRPQGILAAAFCATPGLFGFVLPASVLISKLPAATTIGAARGLDAALGNSALVAALGAIVAMTLALILAYAARRALKGGARLALRAATMGYAMPGAVIAVGVLTLGAHAGRPFGLVLTGGIGVLIYAYAARFLTAGYNAASAGLQQISPLMDAAARSLGAGPAGVVSRIHWPLSRGALTAGALIVFIDIVKELPATLLLRPFNFETLATRVYRLASDERLADAAPAALLLIGLGLLPTILLYAAGGRKREEPAS